MKTLLISLIAATAFAQSAPLAGTFRGTLDAGDVVIHITLRVSASADGALTVVADSPERNAKDAKADVVTLVGKTGFQAEWKTVNVKCDARLSEDGSVLDTSWDSPEGSAPARLKRVPATPAP